MTIGNEFKMYDFEKGHSRKMKHFNERQIAQKIFDMVLPRPVAHWVQFIFTILRGGKRSRLHKGYEEYACAHKITQMAS